MNRILVACAAAVLVAFAPASGFAADAAFDAGTPVPDATTYPYVEGTLDLELDNDWVFDSSDPTQQFNNLYTSNTLAMKVHVTPVLSVDLGLTLEQVTDPSPPANCTMCNIGLYMDTLDIAVETGNWAFVAGKHEPDFGFAWDIAPGVFGTSYAEDYELSEMIGLGAAYTFDTAAGKHTLAVNAFFADTTVLSESLLTNRGRTRLADGGAGNTGELNNFAVTLSGEDIPGLAGFRYNIGYRHLSAGDGDFGAENGFVAGVAKDTDLGNDLTLGLLAEAAYFDNVGGTDDAALYATAGVSLTRGPWHGEFVGMVRDYRIAGTDHLMQISGGYTFDSGVDASIGYAYDHSGGIDNQIIGLRLTKSIDFSSR